MIYPLLPALGGINFKKEAFPRADFLKPQTLQCSILSFITHSFIHSFIYCLFVCLLACCIGSSLLLAGFL